MSEKYIFQTLRLQLHWNNKEQQQKSAKGQVNLCACVHVCHKQILATPCKKIYFIHSSFCSVIVAILMVDKSGHTYNFDICGIL